MPSTREKRIAQSRARYKRAKIEDPEDLRKRQHDAYVKRMSDPVKAEAHRAHTREKMREYRASNPKKAKAAHRKAHEALMSDAERLARKRAHAREYQKRFRENNWRGWYSSKLKSNYGITLEGYEDMLKKQDGVCAICKQPEKAASYRKPGACLALSVDHCHSTGKVRGLLCTNCNRGLGFFQHDRVLLKSASAYLRRS